MHSCCCFAVCLAGRGCTGRRRLRWRLVPRVCLSLKDAVELGVAPITAGDDVLGGPIELEPEERFAEGGAHGLLVLALGGPNLGVEVPRHEVEPGAGLCGGQGVADHASGVGPRVWWKVDVVDVDGLGQFGVSEGCRHPVPRGKDPSGRMDEGLGGDHRHPALGAGCWVVALRARGVGEGHCGSGEEAAPHSGTPGTSVSLGARR